MRKNEYPGVPGVAQALWSLGVRDYIIKGNPTTEDEFKAKFRKFNGDDEITDPTKWGVTWTQVKAEKDKLLADYNNRNYQRERVKDYPHISDQLDMLYWDKKNGTNTWVEAIDKVKSDTPKS